jgi:hypothetical protein
VIGRVGPPLQEDVARLEIAMEHSLAVRVGERAQDLPDDPERAGR